MLGAHIRLHAVVAINLQQVFYFFLHFPPAFSVLVQGQGYSSCGSASTSTAARAPTHHSHHSAFSSVGAAGRGCLTDFDPNLNSAATSSTSSAISTSASSSVYGNVILTAAAGTSSSSADDLHLDDQSSYILSPSDARFLNSFVRHSASTGPPPSYEEHQVVAADLNQLSISANEYQLDSTGGGGGGGGSATDFGGPPSDQIIFRSSGRFYQNVSLLGNNPDDNSVELVSEVQAMLNNYAAGHFSDLDAKNEFNLEPMSVVFKEEDHSADYGLSSHGDEATIITDLEKYSPSFKGDSTVLDSIGPVLDREQERLLLENTMSPLCKYKIYLFIHSLF